MDCSAVGIRNVNGPANHDGQVIAHYDPVAERYDRQRLVRLVCHLVCHGRDVASRYGHQRKEHK